MAPPVCPGQRHVTSKLFDKPVKCQYRIFKNLKIPTSSIITNGAVSKFGKTQIEKYRGRNLHYLHIQWVSLNLTAAFL